MLKLGICERGQDSSWTRLFRRGPHSARLLHGAGPAEFDRLMPHICLSNSTARTTRPNRFLALHEEIAPILLAHLPLGRSLRVEDWAVSSGTTAMEWFERLKRDFRQLRFSASDWMLYLIEVHRPADGDTFILEADGTPIQYVRPPFVVHLIQPTHAVYPVNRQLRRQALRLWQQNLKPNFALPTADELSSGSVLEQNTLRIRQLPLLHPRVTSLASENFQIRKHSVFEPAPALVHMVRTMNILNRAYFSEERLRAAAAAVAASLEPGGLWIVGRTVTENPPRHEISILEKQPDGWRALWRSNGGSEIEPLLRLL